MSLPNALVLVSNDEHKGRSYKIEKICTSIGRVEGENDIVLDDRYVTKSHARIIYGEGGFFIYDLDSTNGTYVNGRKTIAGELRDGDRIEMGKSVLTFRVIN